MTDSDLGSKLACRERSSNDSRDERTSSRALSDAHLTAVVAGELAVIASRRVADLRFALSPASDGTPSSMRTPNGRWASVSDLQLSVSEVALPEGVGVGDVHVSVDAVDDSFTFPCSQRLVQGLTADA